MKKIIFYCSVTSLLFISCSQENLIETIPVENSPKIIKIPSKNLLYDEIYEVRNGEEIKLTNEQWPTRAVSTQNSYDITTASPTYIYPGSIISEKSVDRGIYVPVGYPNEWKETVTISFSLPVLSKKIALTKSAFMNAISEAVKDANFDGSQSQSFTYGMKKIRYYNEMKLAFGANVNIGQIFSIGVYGEKAKTQFNTALFIDFSQTYFSVFVDIPNDGNIFKDESIRNKYSILNPVYINTINYGRKGIILVESEKSYEETSLAVRAAFNAKIVNGALGLDVAQKELLEKANIQTYIVGGDGRGATKAILGFKEFQNFIIKGGVYTKDVYGVPITFSAAYANDNSVFETTFEVDYDE